MRCHYCEREASFTAESDGLRVGLCDEHFRTRFRELAESDALASLRRKLDVERSRR